VARFGAPGGSRIDTPVVLPSSRTSGIEVVLDDSL
jgi:hypothetical protein